jgi:hypothetical protein
MATWKKVIVSGSDAELNKLTVTNGITGSLKGTASYADSSSITYVSNSMYGLSEIEVADYDNNVAVTYVNGRLKFIFGTPVAHAISSFTDGTTFLVDRFTTQTDSYNITGNWANNGYTFTQARIMQGASVIASTTTANSTTLSATGLSTTGTQAYVLEVSASNPLTSTIVPITQTLTLTVSKTLAGVPTISATPTVQLNASGFQIEQGATGSISVTSNVGSANSWTLLTFTGTGSYGTTPTSLFGNTTGVTGTGTFNVTGTATGSSAIAIQATASYNTNGLSSPETSSIRYATNTTYSKIRSIRYGTIASNLTASLSQSFLENLANWDTSLGGTIGTIVKGTVDPLTTGYTCPALTTTGNHFVFVVDYNISGNVLNSITNTGANLNDIANFTSVNVNNTYRVYYSTNPSAATITYKIAR